MASDIVTVCREATENLSSQDLAIVLSFLFSCYTIIAVAVSALAIYEASDGHTTLRRVYSSGSSSM